MPCVDLAFANTFVVDDSVSIKSECSFATHVYVSPRLYLLPLAVSFSFHVTDCFTFLFHFSPTMTCHCQSNLVDRLLSILTCCSIV